MEEKLDSIEVMGQGTLSMGFQFAIGECVTTKMALEDIKVVKSGMTEHDINFAKRGGTVLAPLRLFILERRLQECPGGTQKHYLCHYYTTRDGYKTEFFNEIELVAYPNEP